LRKALDQAARALAANRAPSSLRQHAGLLLQARETERAVEELSEAAELDPADARSWSDLAAAHLQRGGEHGDPYEIVLALSAAHRAVRQNPSLPAARFNRALALTHLSLRADAAEEWRLFQRHERDPSWLREGRRHAAALADSPVEPAREAQLQAVELAQEKGDEVQIRKLVASSPQQLREAAEETLLPGWAESERDGSESGRRLETACSIGEVLAVQGDPMVEATCAHLKVLRAAAPRRFRLLVGGFAEYGRGLALVRDGDFFQALARFRSAESTLTAQGSPFAGWAAFQAALCHYQLSENGKAREGLSALTRDRAKSRYKALQGRSFLMLGLMDVIEGNPTVALAELDSALSAFQNVNERAFVAKIESLVASALDSLGQRAEAWRRIYPALLEPKARHQPKVWSTICEVASFMAREQGDPEIALGFQGELLRSAYAPFAAVEALRGRVGLLASLGRRSEAARDLAQARLVLQKIPEESRETLEGDLWLAEAELARGDSPAEALNALDKALAILRATSYHYRLSEALFQRAAVESTLGRTDAAERDLAAALNESERQREQIGSPQERISFFDRTREMFDTMIALQIARGRSDEALLYSEQAKARVLWDWIRTQPAGGVAASRKPQPESTSLKIGPLLRSLRPETAVLHYAVLPRMTVVWVLRHDREPWKTTLAVGDRDLAERVAALHNDLEARRKDELQAAAESLYDTLIAPAEAMLNPGERLVVVPDRALHRLSFAMLRNRRTGRYLVQEHVLAVTPSLRIFAASLRRDGALRRDEGARALVVSDPAFDLTLYPRLSRLSPRAADATDAAVTGNFPGSQVLRGESATRRAFLRAADHFELIHFGGHSVINPESPLLSQMLFAPEPGEQGRGVLYSHDILRQRFARTRLAVLASCETAQGRMNRTEGVESLARPFLAAGVPAVVASLWSVDDEPTAELFARFYIHLRSDSDPPGALRAAQVEAIEGGGKAGDPLSWGAFEVIGGAAGPSLRHDHER
jgi:CHAT domain-containing protein